MKVLVVDDSVVFRSQIKAVLESLPEIKEISLASNGKLALQKLETTDFDIMTLDLEMPEMNGLDTLAAMKNLRHRPSVIVFSSLTSRGAEETFKAMELGAADFSTKPNGVQNLEEAQKHIRTDLLPKIQGLMQRIQRFQRPALATKTEPTIAPLIEFPLSQDTQPRPWTKVSLDIFRPSAIVIGSSTGGPAALKSLLQAVRAPLSIPIFITQHMPPIFTKTLADNIALQLGVETAEGKNLETIKPGKIYIAPGDFHMTIKIWAEKPVICLDQKEKRNSVRPAVDPLFESAAEIYGSRLLGIVLTGMGQDGAVGAKAIKEQKGAVLIQDEASSTVWGMPGAVYKLGAYDGIYSLQDLERILRLQLGKAA